MQDLIQTTNKTKPQTQSSTDRISTALLIRGKTNKQKLSINFTLYKAQPIQSSNHWTNLRRAETKRKKEFNLEAWEKETAITIKKKKTKTMKRQRRTAQMKEQTRNTEVQIMKRKQLTYLKKN